MPAFARILVLVIATILTGTSAAASVPVQTGPDATARELYGASRLRDVLENIQAPPGAKVVLTRGAVGGPESFRLESSASQWTVTGADASGVLYGCLELVRRIRETGTLPARLNVAEGPAFKVRGTNLFWMKWGDMGYNWPVVPENFPWFFDRQLMLRYLDELVDNRYNTIFFWTGHPFPYFLELPRHPEARMLSDAELKRNIEHLKWFTEEADRRGIWTVLHFYNIHVSPAFAKAHEREGVRVENHASTPLLEAYTRYCVGEFVKSYPNVGLMLTAGEALNVKREEFIRDAVIAGIRDSGKNPPLIVRAWSISFERYRDVVKDQYSNLFTMMKHNTEMIDSPYPDPRNRDYIGLGQHHIVNVHENSDVKPFRWASPVFIQQMVHIWQEWGVEGFHLYPMVSWQWPVSLDRTDPPLSTIDRDRVWIEAFGRYGWNPKRPAEQEAKHWVEELAARFGTPEAGKAVYDYYVKSGPVMPGCQNLVNIYNMNYHPTAVSREANLNGILYSDRLEGLGDNLARPVDDLTLALYEKRYGPVSAAARSKPPLSVMDYVRDPSQEGLKPAELTALYAAMAEEALAGLEKNAAGATRERAEYGRFVNDARAVTELAHFYRDKVAAAIEKGLYDNSGERAHYDRMLRSLEASVKAYAGLDRLATPAYRQATDLGEWMRWDVTARGFAEEAAFYREQAEVAARGAEVVYLGLDGPMNDASNVFHWLIERSRTKAGWSSQSYCLGDNLLKRARLLVVYDLASPAFQERRSEIEKWVRSGGKLVVWDPLARASGGGLLEGIRFGADLAWSAGREIAFDEVQHPLVAGLAGTTAPVGAMDALASSIHSTNGEWQELSYTLLASPGSGQYANGRETFGPRWTSLMNHRRVPLMVARRYGSGSVVVAQLGAAHVRSGGSGPAAPPVDAAPLALQKLAENLVGWSGK
jgi:type 1 glutamine amidotransferase